MGNVRIIVENEIRTTLSKRSFWLMTILFPAVILLLNLGSQLFLQDEFESPAAKFMPGPETAVAVPQLGYVDEAGIINELPPDIPAAVLQAFADDTAAAAALSAGEIDRYLIIPVNYPAADPILIDPDFSPMNTRPEHLFSYLLTYNLVNDSVLAQTLLNPTAQLRGEALAPVEVSTLPVSPVMSLVPFIVMFIFFFLLVTSSGYMLQSVSKEKENRTMEVLLVSMEPRQLMLGKVIGLGFVALLQMAVWLGGAVLVMNGRFDLPFLAGVELPAGFLFWAILFFLGGYFLYSALMGIAGAMAPNAREASQFTFVILLPLLIPLWLNASLTQNLNGGLAVGLSLFPLTAPVTMMMRLAGTAVPLWQLGASLAGLLGLAYLFVLLAARFFRADTLLSLAPASWRTIRKAWRTG